MEHFEQEEQLYALTAVSNLHKLYLTRQRLTSPACWYPCCWIRVIWNLMGTHKFAHG